MFSKMHVDLQDYRIVRVGFPQHGDLFLDGGTDDKLAGGGSVMLQSERSWSPQRGDRVIVIEIERVEESASICDLSEPNVANITVNVNVEPVEEVLSSLAGKLERAAAELRS